MRQRKKSKPRRRNAVGKTTTVSGVEVTEIGGMGDGVGTIDNSPVFVPLSAPGDILTLDMIGNRGEIRSIEKAGSHRTEAPCPHFGSCGGCSLQHLTPDFVDQWKRQKLASALSKAGLQDVKIENGINIASGQRRRVSLSFVIASGETVLGFKKRRTHQVDHIDHCLLLTEDLNQSLSPLSDFLRDGFDNGVSGQALVTECANGVSVDLTIDKSKSERDFSNRHAQLSTSAAVSSFERVTIDGELLSQRKPMMVEFEDIEVEFSIGGFLQPSLAGESALRTLVAAEIVKRAKAGSHIVDLFCGCGALTLPLARDYRLSAFDGSKSAIASLETAVRNTQGLKPVVVDVRDLNERPIMAAELKNVGVVVLDPPRAGAAIQIQQLIKSRVSTVIYVSCNVATFARDSKALADAGFALETVTPVDQFKHSDHLECVGVLTRETP